MHHFSITSLPYFLTVHQTFCPIAPIYSILFYYLLSTLRKTKGTLQSKTKYLTIFVERNEMIALPHEIFVRRDDFAKQNRIWLLSVFKTLDLYRSINIWRLFRVSGKEAKIPCTWAVTLSVCLAWVISSTTPGNRYRRHAWEKDQCWLVNWSIRHKLQIDNSVDDNADYTHPHQHHTVKPLLTL